MVVLTGVALRLSVSVVGFSGVPQMKHLRE